MSTALQTLHARSRWRRPSTGQLGSEFFRDAQKATGEEIRKNLAKCLLMLGMIKCLILANPATPQHLIKKEMVLHGLEPGPHLEEHETDRVWGCCISDEKFELSALPPVPFFPPYLFFPTKVVFLPVRSGELHPDCTSPFSSSR